MLSLVGKLCFHLVYFIFKYVNLEKHMQFSRHGEFSWGPMQMKQSSTPVWVTACHRPQSSSTSSEVPPNHSTTTEPMAAKITEKLMWESFLKRTRLATREAITVRSLHTPVKRPHYHNLRSRNNKDQCSQK